jgi:hypothetical protein
MGQGPVHFQTNEAGRSRRSARVAGIFVASMCCVAGVAAMAAARAGQDGTGSSSQLLPSKQGKMIVATAREHEPTRRAVQDCSHLVHEIYERAGFPYAYASSFDLYAGHPSFARVKSPQPGDVIVWPGHAGIVFEPKEHIFFSLVSTGLDQEDYEGPYWKSRGRPRFYRYVMTGRGSVLTASAASASVASASDSTNAAHAWQPGSGTAKAASERSPVYDGTDAEVETTPAGAPKSIVLADGKKKPTREEIAAGISELSSASGVVLRGGEAATATTPVVVVSSMRVASVDLKRDRGWASVQVESSATIAGDLTDLAKNSTEVHWELRKGKSGWEAVAPIGQAYVPRDVAVRELARQLARLTEEGGKRAEEARIAKLLSTLLSEEGEPRVEGSE